jgi:hypothetical protein
VKYYHPEEGTGEVTRVIQERNARHYISRLGIVEAQHAFAIKLPTGNITEPDFAGLRQRLLRDIAQGQFQHVRVTDSLCSAIISPTGTTMQNTNA